MGLLTKSAFVKNKPHIFADTVFIFDVGGVVVKNFFVLPQICKKIGITEEVFFKYTGSPVVYASDNSSKPDHAASTNYGLLAALQSGHISSEEFWLLFYRRSGIKVPENYWKTLFASTLDMAVVALIDRLKWDGYRVVCGSNTLDVHYEYHQQTGQYAMFDDLYVSHKMGVIKPLAEFWLHITDAENSWRKEQGLRPLPLEKFFFIDDFLPNIRAAQKVGLQAVHFTSAQELEGVLYG